MEPNQSRIINIPRQYKPSTRQKIADDILSRIKERTSLGLSVANSPFPGYSLSYDKTGIVNLLESGDMLSSLKVLSHGPGFVRIGFTSSEANDKAAYIQKPTGQKAGKQPRREFVGISQPDLNTKVKRYPPDV